MRYWPVSSVTTDRTFSISTGLAASTVTPGRTAPDASLTTPVMTAWADAIDGTNTHTNATRKNAQDPWIRFSITVLLTCGCKRPSGSRRLVLPPMHVKPNHRAARHGREHGIAVFCATYDDRRYQTMKSSMSSRMPLTRV